MITIEGEGEIIHVKDINGKSFLTSKHNGLTKLNTSDLPSGIYFLEVISSAGSMIWKIVK